MASTSSERRLAAQVSAYSSWAQTENRTARTQPARDALLRKFEQQVDPDGTLSPVERDKRVQAARKAYYASLALRSARARRLAKEAAEAEAALSEAGAA